MGSVSRADKTCGTKETIGEGEERGSEGEEIEGRGSVMTTMRGRPSGGDVIVRFGKIKGEDKKGQSS